MERRQCKGARFRARFGARLTAEELPSSGVVVRIAKSGSVNGGDSRRSRSSCIERRAAARRGSAQRRGVVARRSACAEEWLRGGAVARGEPAVLCGGRAGLVWSACAEEWLRGGAAARGEPAMLCGGRAVLVWCGGRAVLVWCGVVWWLGTKSEENAKRMKKARRRKGEMKGKTLLRKIRRTTSVKQGNRCNITALCRKPIFF